MSCKCKWPDDFCDLCEYQFACGEVAEECPVEGCSHRRFVERFHDQGYSDFVRERQPERFHDPGIKNAV